MDKEPKVIILTLNFNGRELLEDCLSSYLENDYPNKEVVMIDNGSHDGSCKYVQNNFPQVKVIRSEINLKYSGGFNLGLKYAFEEEQADFVLITNNDVKADKHLVSALVEAALQDESRGFVIGKVYYFDQPDTLQTVGKKYDPVLWNGGHIGNLEVDTGQYDEPGERAWCDDIYWLVSRRVYQVTGGYDAEFSFQAEDFDWEVRGKQAGFKIYYTPKAKLWHKESVTLGRTSPMKSYYDARNPLIVHIRYRSADEFRRFFRIRFKVLLRSMFNLLIRFKWEHFYATASGLGSALRYGIRHHKFTIRHFVKI